MTAEIVLLEPHEHGYVFAVLAQPGAKRAGILGVREGALRVAVSAAPEKGKANQALIDLLADRFDCPRSALTLIAGATSRRKRFLIQGLKLEELRQRLQPR